MPKRAKSKPSGVAEHWNATSKKWRALLPQLIERLDGSRRFWRPTTDDEYLAAGYKPFPAWKPGPNTITRPPDQWPKTEAQYLEDGWERAHGWRGGPFPLDLAALELAAATSDIAVAAKRDRLSAVPALRFIRRLRQGGLPTPDLLDLHAEVELLIEEMNLDRDAKPKARTLDDLESRIVHILLEEHGKVVKSGDLYKRSRAMQRMQPDAFRKRMRRLCEEEWAERIGHSYRIGRKAGRPDSS